MNEIAKLETLAASVGVLTKYHTWKGGIHEARPEVLLQVLQTLGLEIAGVDDAPAALQARQRHLWQELVPPCTVAWGEDDASLVLRLPASVGGPFSIDVTFESGDTRRIDGRLEDIAPVEHAEVDGQTHVLRRIPVPIGGVHGYHRATVHAGKRTSESLIIAAPVRAYRSPDAARSWGIFAPLYAVHGHDTGGTGDLGDMMRMCRWVHAHGGSLVGTLPLLSTYLDEPCEYSPYSPVSRLFWNELYIDLATAPGFDASPAAQARLSSAAFRAEADALRAMPLVDYRRQMALARGVIEQLADTAWQSDALRAQMDAFMQRNQRVDDYARFRARVDKDGQVWLFWPEQQQAGVLAPGDYDERARRYHVYAQFAMDAQLARLDRKGGAELYLDLPVGVQRYGYDTWRNREVFAMDMSAGAPPDALFSEGQNWGGAPLHPWNLRHHGYRYFIESVRTHFEHAGMLRVDHAMGLHRMYWVPEGVSAKEGVYVHYEAGEMYAILSIESHRHHCAVAGEDLGTVPDYVRPSMERHGLSRLYVGQFSLPSHPGAPVDSVPAEAVASINTHDTPSFAGFWQGLDIDDRVEMGLIDEDEARAEHVQRQEQCRATAAFLCERGHLDTSAAGDPHAVLCAFNAYLAESDADLVILNLEDMWLDPHPQNVPGTSTERPNWRRKMKKSLEEIETDEQVLSVLGMIDRIRRGSAKP